MRTPEHRPALQWLLSRWRGSLLWFLLFAFLQQCTFRDTVRGLDLIFYAMPSPVLLALCLLVVVASFRGRRAKHRRVLGVAVALAVVVTSWWMHTSYIRSTPSHGPTDLTIQLWNAARGKNGAAVLRELGARGGDIIALVEAGASRFTPEQWQEALPGYTIEPLDGGMLVAVRGRILECEYTQVGSRRARFNNVLLELVGETTRTVRLILVDIHSSPLYNKERPFQEFQGLIRKHATEPLIVAGDFNTPLQSVHFEKLRSAGMTHTFESSGNGFVETYLYNIPVLAIDHVWVNDRFRSVETNKARTWASDHQAVVAELALVNPE